MCPYVDTNGDNTRLCVAVSLFSGYSAGAATPAGEAVGNYPGGLVCFAVHAVVCLPQISENHNHFALRFTLLYRPKRIGQVSKWKRLRYVRPDPAISKPLRNSRLVGATGSH